MAINDDVMQRMAALEAQEQEGRFSAVEMAKNFPGDAYQVGEEMYQTVRHPIDTAKALGNLALGGVQKLIPGEQDSEKYADLLVEDIKSKYGSWEKFTKELEANPAHVLMDVAPLGAVAGKVMKAAGLAKVGDITTKASMAADPINMAMMMPKAAEKAFAMTKNPADLYKSSVKFSTVADKKQGIGTRDKFAETAVAEGILPTQAGMMKLDARMTEVNTLIDNLVDVAQDTGARFPINNLKAGIDALKQDLAGFKFKGVDRTKTINKVWNDFKTEMRDKGITDVGVRELQEFKKDLHKQIKDWNRKPGDDPTPELAKKAIDREARKGVEGFVPEVKDLNRQYGDMAGLKEALFPAYGRIENRDMGGIGMPIKASAGADMGRAVAGDVGALVGGGIGAAHGYLDAPLNKARLAIRMSKKKQQSLAEAISQGAPAFWAKQFAQQSGEQSEKQRRFNSITGY